MQLVSLILLRWIVIYPVDSAIQRLNNRGQNITAKLNECKTKTFSQKTVQRVLHSEGYKRRLSKKKIVLREANQKKRVKWCKERRGRTVDNYWEKVFSSFLRWKSDCARYKQRGLSNTVDVIRVDRVNCGVDKCISLRGLRNFLACLVGKL